MRIKHKKSDNSVDTTKEDARRDKLSFFEEIRQDLITENFVVKMLGDEIDRKIKRLHKLLQKKPVTSDYQNHLEKLGHAVRIHSQLLFVGGDKLFKHRNDFVIVRKELPVKITEQGIYIRFNPYATKEQWDQLYEKAKSLEQEFPVYKETHQEDFQKLRSREQIGLKDPEEKVWIYLEIEKRIPKFWKAKQKGKTKQTLYTAKSGISVVDRAIEAVIAKKNLGDFKEENRLKLQYKDTYYRVAERYLLPTLRELPKYLELFDEIAS